MGSYDELYDRLKNDPAALQQGIAEVVRVSDDDVLTSMLRQAQVFMEWAYLQVKAEMDAKKARIYLEETILPICRIKADAILKEAGERSSVEKRNDLAVNEEDYKLSQQHYLIAQERAMVLKRVVDALFQKKDMLQSLNSRQRVELDALPHDRPPPDSWDPGLQDDSADGPTTGPQNGDQKLTEAELRSKVQVGREAFRKKRKEGLIRKLGRKALLEKTENLE